jgi:nitroimidazol reductase NimA-like FMN-containing flavoprotein (pyridoxamine 5'-phosphate oxidase superfamily)
MGTVRTWLVDIPLEECEELLATSAFGRLGVIVDGRPEIFPISHVYDRQAHVLAFPTNARTKLRAALDWPWVAYEVDDVDLDRTGGWSVMVVGRAEEIVDAAETARLAELRSVRWAPDESARWICVVPTKTTGRRIKIVDGGPVLREQ